MNKEINDMNIKTWSILRRGYSNIMVSVSGGSDSDILIDLVERNKQSDQSIHYVFFNTGLEYQATHDHLDYLETNYNITIERIRPTKPIPLAVKEHGIPFFSKYVSEMIDRLQRHNFSFEDKPYEVLLQEYPNCKSALKWWCNSRDDKSNGTKSSFNINYIRGLKEFLVANPPTFRISSKCCKYAKKDLAHEYKSNNNIDLSITGVRKAEGGARASAYKNCFSTYGDKCDEYRPLFYLSNEDKEEYDTLYSISHSKCYTQYGLKRTGCVGCPFAKDFVFELEVIQKYEPKLYKAVTNVMGKSYEYKRNFYEFRDTEE